MSQNASAASDASSQRSASELSNSSRSRRWLLPLILFLATCVSVFYRGAGMFAAQTLYDSATGQFFREDFVFANFVKRGLLFSACVMGILIAHELGHFFQTVRYGVRASFPYFIPFPFSPFGTMGAVIVQSGSNADRRAMFDIAISGPIAGLVVAIPLLCWGIKTCHVTPAPHLPGVSEFGEPLLLSWLTAALIGPIPEGHSTWLNPPMFAGWFGLFITALNLLPVGQLDGGHIFYCLLPRQGPKLTRRIYSVLVATVILGSMFFDKRLMAWGPILGLLWYMGIEHPPTADDSVPLGPVRTLCGWLTLAFIVVGFTPIPFG